jgi:hypothetical protein
MDMLAVAGSALLQVPPLGLLLRAEVKPTHILAVPVIAPGEVSTVTTVDFEQPALTI